MSIEVYPRYSNYMKCRSELNNYNCDIDETKINKSTLKKLFCLVVKSAVIYFPSGSHSGKRRKFKIVWAQNKNLKKSMQQ